MAKLISGERSLKVGGETYTLRLGFDALSAIEDRYGSIITIMADISRGDPKLSLLSYIFSCTANLDQTRAFAISMEYKREVFECIIEVINATLNPEKETASKSGE